MYTIVYVLVDNESLCYYKELMISLKSLRKHMSKVSVCVLTDPETYALLERTSAEVFDLAKVEKVDTPEEFSKVERSRYLKVTARKHVKGDMLYIDTDTIICCPLPKTVSQRSLAAVFDYNTKLSCVEKSQYNAVYNKNKCLGIQLDKDEYYNSGVLWAKDTEVAGEFFDAWEKKWNETRKRGLHIDQPSFNYTISAFSNHFERLENIWNLQVSSSVMPIQCLAESYIIHYFNACDSSYLLCDKEIRTLNYNDAIIQNIIDAPRKAFYKSKLLKLTPETEALLDSKQYDFLVNRLYLNHKKLFLFFEKIFAMMYKVLQYFQRN